MLKSFQLSLLSLSMVAALAMNSAHALQINGSTSATVALTQQSDNQKSLSVSVGLKKTVYLMRVKLTAKELNILNRKTKFKTPNLMSVSASSLPAYADVNVDMLPVLDQGQHGACVTFATTAAFDSLMNRGDYISQLCLLELGSYLEKSTYLASGWSGNTGPAVLNLLMGNGIVSKATQARGGCGGKIDYPVADAGDTGTPISLQDYHAASEPLNSEKSVYFTASLLETSTRFLASEDSGFDADKVLNQVKKALADATIVDSDSDGEFDTRVTFGVLLPVTHCYAGACARYHEKNDTWSLTSAIDHDDNVTLAGHEMMIIGYDDRATVTDDDGVTHKGILKLRNSWGSDVGDKGNYYMTYDFFKRFVIEVQKIGRVSSQDNS